MTEYNWKVHGQQEKKWEDEKISKVKTDMVKSL